MRVILHYEQPSWWAEVPEHKYTAAAESLAKVKELCRESAAIEQWGDPEWELCPCAKFGECTT